jgi:hypothetical protein
MIRQRYVQGYSYIPSYKLHCHIHTIAHKCSIIVILQSHAETEVMAWSSGYWKQSGFKSWLCSLMLFDFGPLSWLQGTSYLLSVKQVLLPYRIILWMK